MLEHILSNGMPVFIEEKKSSPVVTVQAWIRQGSAHEEDEIAGISHFIEHAVFKGTKKRTADQIASAIESCGGEINAFTSYEETAYHATLPSNEVNIAIEVISDIIQNPTFNSEEIAQEKEVILEEIRRIDDSISSQLSINLWKECFPKSPYYRPIIGFENTVKNISEKDLKEYFTKTYNSSTSSLFIIGDIKAEKIIQQTEKNFSSIPKGTINTIKPFTLEIPNEMKIISISKDIKETYLQMGFITHGITDNIIPSIDLLCSILGQGESSRLYQQLVKNKKLALDVYMNLIATSKCGIAIIGIALEPKNIYQVVHEIASLIRNTFLTPIESIEMERVKNSIEAEITFGKETVDGLARRFGYYYTLFNDPEYEKKYFDKIMALNKKDISNALEYINSANPVLSIVHPNDFNLNPTKIKSNYKTSLKLEKKEKKTNIFKTQNKKITIISKELDSLPIISIKFIWPGGLEYEEQHGISNLFQELWTKETSNFSTFELSHMLESLGASIEGFSGKSSVGISVDFLTKHWTVIKPILKEIIFYPRFSKDEFNIQKSITLNLILAERDNPANMCQINFMKQLYGEHPYGKTILGTQKSVNSITRSDIIKFHKKIISFPPTISAVGAFPLRDINEEIMDLFSNFYARKKVRRTLKEPKSPEKTKVIIDTKEPLFQSHLMVGFMGCSFFDKDRYALKLLSSCLAGQGGRLFVELREKKSLAYSVAPLLTEAPRRGVFAIYIACAPEKLFNAISEIRKELEKVITTNISHNELNRAKKYLLGRFELELQKYSSQASMLGFDEFYGLNFNHYEKMKEIILKTSIDHISTAAKKYIKLDQAVISIVNPNIIDAEKLLKFWEA